MKNARNRYGALSATNPGSLSTCTLPLRVDTLTARFLAALLEERELTGMESEFCESFTRATAWVRYLKSRYGWPIESRKIVIATNDGRILWGTAYSLPSYARHIAATTSTRKWIDAVNVVTAKRRRAAKRLKKIALELNAKREAADD